MSIASKVTSQVVARLDQIRPDNGYKTDLKAVYRRQEKIPEKPAMPYAVVRVVNDRRTSTACLQATRLRTYAIDVVFSARAEDEQLDDVGVDILRALGIGRVDFEDKLPGLVDDEDEQDFTYAETGITSRSITTTIGVTYVEDYN